MIPNLDDYPHSLLCVILRYTMYLSQWWVEFELRAHIDTYARLYIDSEGFVLLPEVTKSFSIYYHSHSLNLLTFKTSNFSWSTFAKEDINTIWMAKFAWNHQTGHPTFVQYWIWVNFIISSEKALTNSSGILTNLI